MSLAEAWAQASEQTGLSAVSPDVGLGIGIALGVAEVLWWVLVGYATKKGWKMLRRNSRKNDRPQGAGNRSWPPQA